MHPALLDILCCPRCREGGLRLSGEPDGGRILSGRLTCRGCSAVYTIEGGVPELLAAGHSVPVQEAFSRQWRWRSEGAFEEPGRLYCRPHRERAADMAARLAGSLEAGAAPTPWVLDAGCGTGELLAELARRHPALRFVGMDFASPLRKAVKAWGDLPNLDLVRADVAAPPFAPGSFRAAYSLGVLHHTPDTHRSFGETARLVAPGGELSIWLYPHPDDLVALPAAQRRYMGLYYLLRDRILLGRGHLLPPWMLLVLLRALAAPVLLLPRPRHPPYTDLSRRQLHASLVFVLYDGVVPRFQHRHQRAEVEGWFRKAGFTAVRGGTAPDHTLGSFTGRKPPEALAPARSRESSGAR